MRFSYIQNQIFTANRLYISEKAQPRNADQTSDPQAGRHSQISFLLPSKLYSFALRRSHLCVPSVEFVSVNDHSPYPSQLIVRALSALEVENRPHVRLRQVRIWIITPQSPTDQSSRASQPAQPVRKAAAGHHK